MKTFEFLSVAVQNLKTVGSFFPHTRFAAAKMVKPIDCSSALMILELGGGSGAVTRLILRRMRQDARLFAFEINPVFAQSLRRFNDPRLTVIEDSAVKLEEHLKRLGVGQVDAVISTLPLVIMDEKTRDTIISSALRVLKPGGKYVQIQYSLTSKKDLERRFKNIKIDFTPFNLPPAFFYTVTKI